MCAYIFTSTIIAVVYLLQYPLHDLKVIFVMGLHKICTAMNKYNLHQHHI